MVVEKKKYIIELPENTHWIQWIMEGTKDHHSYMDYKQVEDLTPYTEPDMEQVRKEAYEQGQKDLRESCVPQDEEAYSFGYTEGFQCGLDLAWEAARKIQDAGGNFSWWIHNTTASEAIEGIRVYEQAQKESEESKKEQSVTTEEVMRQYLDMFCNKKMCARCPLYTPDFTCGRGYHFLTHSRISDEEVRRAYAEVLQKMEEN